MKTNEQSSQMESLLDPSVKQRCIRLAQSVIAIQVLFTFGWIIAGFLEDNGYSIANHDISDMGALTARNPLLYMVPTGITGIATIWFCIGALHPILKISGVRRPIGAWFLALSLMGLDNFSDMIFRLDCRAADLGCTQEVATASLQGKLHVIIALVSVLFTVIAPFFLSRHMRNLNRWKDLKSKTFIFGIFFLMALIGYILTDGNYGHGYVQRIMCLMLSFGIIVLARRVIKIATL
ncbi:MAG: DUF998 domain-containing protein [Saprospiraceae bacterium]